MSRDTLLTADDAAAHHCNLALDLIYEDVSRAQVNALISIAVSLMEG